MKRLARQLCDEAEALGYVCSGTNSAGFLVYAHPDGHEVRINPSVSEHHAREVQKAMRKATGTLTVAPGRSGQKAKARQQQRRQLDAARITAERRELQAQRDSYLARIAGAPHLTHDRDALRLVEARLAELSQLEQLMKTGPATDRRARHTAGDRVAAS